jgi:hypothetical protein
MKPSKPDADSPLHGLLRYLPILQWLPQYQFSWLRADIVAGLTVWAVMVPEAMAYAGIAGVPPLVGLYTVPIPLIAYAVFGTSRAYTTDRLCAVRHLADHGHRAGLGDRADLGRHRRRGGRLA